MSENYNIGVHVPEILLPDKSVSMPEWSVVACDQYTSEPEYWEKVKNIVGDKPSTLNLIYPEVYLNEPDKPDRISKINKKMKQYIDNNILVQQKPGFIYVDRKTSHTLSRKGLIISVDLEDYDYNKGSQTLIRATEGTVLERIPPRVKIRENAYVELPHIMILIDDPEKTVIEPIAQKASELKKVYDFDLMMNGGHITGYSIDNMEMINSILDSFEKLADPEKFNHKYNLDGTKKVLLFAVGDGNHSLATAKAHWENVKKTLSQDQMSNHPARYALCEIVNIHDEGIRFEPIHRVVFNVDSENLVNEFKDYCNKQDEDAELVLSPSDEKWAEIKSNIDNKVGVHIIPFLTGNEYGCIIINKPKLNLAVGTLQDFLDHYSNEKNKLNIDYIHGASVVKKLASDKNNIGFFLPTMDKNELFRTVILEGALPRKTFSMGEAEEKRFYLECRKIK